MHPAISVIFFTTFSGTGYGLAFMLSLGFTAPWLFQTKLGWFISLTLIASGLLSSLLHLGNPQRAWRAFSQWRSSWLSREGCMSIITFVPLCSLAALSIFDNRTLIFVGIVGSLFSILTVYCTAMIYASLRTIPQWHTWLTPLCYLCFSLSSGSLLLYSLFPSLPKNYLFSTFACLLTAYLVKHLWHRRAITIGTGETDIASATGLGHLGEVKLLEPPHSLDNYLTNEMVFRLARKHEVILWRLSIFFGLIVPIAVVLVPHLVLSIPYGSYSPFIGFLSHLLGLFLERYLFFALARHTVSLYYGK